MRDVSVKNMAMMESFLWKMLFFLRVDIKKEAIRTDLF